MASTNSTHRLLPLLLLLILATAHAPRAAAGLLVPGDAAPRFSYTDIRDGQTKTFAQAAKGKPLLLVFLQTACRSCVREMLALKNIRLETGNFEVLGVFLDLKPRGLEEYVADYDLPFTFTWDGSYTAADAYGVSFSPTSFLIDTEGKVAAVYRGYTQGTDEDFRADLRRLSRSP